MKLSLKPTTKSAWTRATAGKMLLQGVPSRGPRQQTANNADWLRRAILNIFLLSPEPSCPNLHFVTKSLRRKHVAKSLLRGQFVRGQFVAVSWLGSSIKCVEFELGKGYFLIIFAFYKSGECSNLRRLWTNEWFNWFCCQNHCKKGARVTEYVPQFVFARITLCRKMWKRKESFSYLIHWEM